MSSSNDSIKKTLTVALLLCIVCSVIVSGAAVVFKKQQQANKDLDRKTNILAAAGLLQPGKSVDELFAQIKPRVVDLNSGEYASKLNVNTYDQLKAAKDPAMSKALSNSEDIAGIKRRENFATVYLVEKDGKLDRIILPVRGYGLWSTLHGFLALEADANTVIGLGFYQHAETPGLGGEVDNPKWKALWPGKKVYADDSMTPAVEVVKGSVDPSASDAVFKVDGLSGATLTSRGVSHLVQYWMGQEGFGPYLNKIRKEGV
ncbi:Na+-transporting NADH:ubiquinone oxidoreductase subunit C [Oceanospirillum multiglobuliferum]|uniref:Na(+)-translocating NADH-quinone reductase subunit C n=1 Tax=Oceanospirillum multiglobuliferum TaxID=64969 RepID=A0A1T4N9Q2_9GAMM|nr:Na(+)-translocating NADH-quinone reductase subunit C [Oceanospirillum multiglobuliferum]OPX55891.1 Na(+)-translocating NADH-quinone reductase subunit C [Oceanospirillum multiglobuliferum]SJZ76040.1 Na+-transporting NADH:ubiquinone oxidoreductase subunit C [Oceanospirillum multiglobuliferum]